MTSAPLVLARGPWEPAQVTAAWRRDPYRPTAAVERAADAEIKALRERGSPSHDGLSARLVGFDAGPDGLALELQPCRWALRLLTDDRAAESLAALCVVRSADGRWLAGRRAAWLASWAGRWTLGAGGAVEVGENPVDTLSRELHEEWRLVAEHVSVEALIRLPTGMAMIVGVAMVPAGAEPVMDDEHDEFAWWPPDPAAWADGTDERLRRMAGFLAAAA